MRLFPIHNEVSKAKKLRNLSHLNAECSVQLKLNILEDLCKLERKRLTGTDPRPPNR